MYSTVKMSPFLFESLAETVTGRVIFATSLFSVRGKLRERHFFWDLKDMVSQGKTFFFGTCKTWWVRVAARTVTLHFLVRNPGSRLTWASHVDEDSEQYASLTHN